MFLSSFSVSASVDYETLSGSESIASEFSSLEKEHIKKIIYGYKKDILDLRIKTLKDLSYIQNQEVENIKRLERRFENLTGKRNELEAILYKKSMIDISAVLEGNYRTIVGRNFKDFDKYFIDSVRNTMKGIKLNKIESDYVSKFVIEVSREIRNLDMEIEKSTFMKILKSVSGEKFKFGFSKISSRLDNSEVIVIDDFYKKIDDVIISSLSNIYINKKDIYIYAD